MIDLSISNSILRSLAQGYETALAKAEFVQRNRENAGALAFQKEREANDLKLAEQRFKLDSTNQQALRKMQEGQFKLQRLEADNKLGQQVSETGQIPPGVMRAFQNVDQVHIPDIGNLLPQFHRDVMTPPTAGDTLMTEDGTTIPTEDPWTYNARQGQLKFEREAPFRQELSRLKKEQDAANADAKKELADANNLAAAQRDKERREDRADIRGLGRGISSANDEMKDMRLAALKDNLGKLPPKQQEHLEINATELEQIRATKEALDVTIKAGRYKGRKVKDVLLSEGIMNTASNVAGSMIDFVSNTKTPEITTASNLLNRFTVKDVSRTSGKAFTSLEQKVAGDAYTVMGKWFSNRTQILTSLDNIEGALVRSKSATAKLLSPMQRERLDPLFKTVKRFVPKPGSTTGEMILVEE